MFLTTSGLVLGQSEAVKISWSHAAHLTWGDFQGTPLKNTPYHANTNSGISYSWGLKGTSQRMELDYHVETFFYPELSWVQSSSKNQHLLEHEQLHFDISELHARKLRKLLASVDASKLNKDSKEYLNALYEKIDKERSAMQNFYDKESDHSLNKEAQTKWRHYVNKELAFFEAFIL